MIVELNIDALGMRMTTQVLQIPMISLALLLRNPPWFAQILIGIVLGALLPKIGQMLILLGNRFKINHLLGTWHKYHLSYDQGEPKLFQTTWIVQHGLFQEYKVTYKFNDKILKYKGSMRVERDQLLFVLKALYHKETVIYRIDNPLPCKSSETAFLYGIWASYDHDKKIASGAALLCKDKLSETAALEKIKAKFRIADHMPLMRLEI